MYYCANGLKSLNVVVVVVDVIVIDAVVFLDVVVAVCIKVEQWLNTLHSKIKYLGIESLIWWRIFCLVYFRS